MSNAEMIAKYKEAYRRANNLPALVIVHRNGKVSINLGKKISIEKLPAMTKTLQIRAKNGTFNN